MSYLINLFQKETTLLLKKGNYELYFLGGYDVLNMDNFVIGIFDSISGHQLKFEFSHRVRVKINRQPGVKYFKFEVPHDGEYLVLIENPEELRVKESQFRSINVFLPKVERKAKNVFIERVAVS